MLLWKGAYTSQLTEDEIVTVVHLLNRLDKSAFSIKYGHAGPKPAYGLIVRCGDLEIMVSQATSAHASLVMTFDQATSKTFISGQWYISSDELKAHIEALLETKSAQFTQT